MIRRRHPKKEILPHCQQQGIGVIVYAPMASGLLTGAMTRDARGNLAAADDFRSPQVCDIRLSPRLFQESPALVLSASLAKLERATAGTTWVTSAAIAWTLRRSRGHVRGRPIRVRWARRNAKHAGRVIARRRTLKLARERGIAEIEGAAALATATLVSLSVWIGEVLLAPAAVHTPHFPGKADAK